MHSLRGIVTEGVKEGIKYNLVVKRAFIAGSFAISIFYHPAFIAFTPTPLLLTAESTWLHNSIHSASFHTNIYVWSRTIQTAWPVNLFRLIETTMLKGKSGWALPVGSSTYHSSLYASNLELYLVGLYHHRFELMVVKQAKNHFAQTVKDPSSPCYLHNYHNKFGKIQFHIFYLHCSYLYGVIQSISGYLKHHKQKISWAQALLLLILYTEYQAQRKLLSLKKQNLYYMPLWYEHWLWVKPTAYSQRQIQCNFLPAVQRKETMGVQLPTGASERIRNQLIICHFTIEIWIHSVSCLNTA